MISGAMDIPTGDLRESTSALEEQHVYRDSISRGHRRPSRWPAQYCMSIFPFSHAPAERTNTMITIKTTPNIKDLPDFPEKDAFYKLLDKFLPNGKPLYLMNLHLKHFWKHIMARLRMRSRKCDQILKQVPGFAQMSGGWEPVLIKLSFSPFQSGLLPTHIRPLNPQKSRVSPFSPVPPPFLQDQEALDRLVHSAP